MPRYAMTRSVTRFQKPGRQRAQAGMSLVELMVGVTIGLFIVAAATLLVGNQLADNRRLLLETQMQQDMRATMDIVTRQLRRAGTRKNYGGVELLAVPPGAASPLGRSGKFDPEYTDVVINAAGSQVTFDYYLDTLSDNRLSPLSAETNWGFRLTEGRIQTRMADGGWQELTDRSTILVTRFLVTEVLRNSESIPCPNLCPDGTQDCWPRIAVRVYDLVLEARAVSDAAVIRRLQSQVRVRNNLPVFGAGSTDAACPA